MDRAFSLVQYMPYIYQAVNSKDSKENNIYDSLLLRAREGSIKPQNKAQDKKKTIKACRT